MSESTERALRAVDNDDSDDEAAVVGADYQPSTEAVASHIPSFEGQPVEFAKAKVTSVSGLETGDKVWHLDQIVTLVVECRVAGIDHKVNQTTGKLERLHTLKAIDCVPVGASIETIREAQL